MKRISHHWHVLLDDEGKPTPAAIEHEHLVNRGRRHVHRRAYDVMLAELRASLAEGDARALALRLDGTAYTSLDFPKPPVVAPIDERAEVERLHPEVRRSLS